MNLFIDPISSPAKVFLFDDNKSIISKSELIIKWNESSALLDFLINFLNTNDLKTKDLLNIVLVRWPWSFTWVRTAVLVVNSLAFINKTNLTDISYFDLYKDYPIVKTSSKRDCFIKISANDDIVNMPNSDVLKLSDNKQFYWDFIEISNIIVNIDYIDIITNIKLKKLEKIAPLYIKKPNIF